jgi:hypothetical protein
MGDTAPPAEFREMVEDLTTIVLDLAESPPLSPLDDYGSTHVNNAKVSRWYPA